MVDIENVAGFGAAGVAMEPALELFMARVPVKARPFVPLVAAVVIATVHALQTGCTWKQAVLNGVVTTAAAIYKHDSRPSTVGAKLEEAQ